MNVTIFVGKHGFSFSIGYLIAVDDFGVWLEWKPRQRRQRHESMFQRFTFWVFPWWTRPAVIRQRVWVDRMNRKSRKYPSTIEE